MLNDIQLSFLLGMILGGICFFSGFYVKMLYDYYKLKMEGK